MTNISKQLHRVDVFPERDGLTNVIGRVFWAVVFERDGVASAGGAETLLAVDNIATFIPIEQLTKEQILEWAFEAQGGDAFVQQIQPYHEQQLDWMVKCKGLVEYKGLTDVATSQPMAGNAIPQSVL